jgi:hypothetical protein
MTDDHQPQWVTIAQAAKALGKSERTIRRLMATDKLTVDRTPAGVRLDIAGLSPDTTADNGPASPDLAAILAENDRLKAVLEQVTQERDYLRQALAREQSVIMSLTAQPKQLEAPGKRRSWWQFWRIEEDNAGQ